MSDKPRIAVIGAGLGGATAGILLQQAGYDCRLYEQAPSFQRIGAGINVAPNSTRIFRSLGLSDEMRQVGIQPHIKYSRQWDSGEVMFTVPVAELTKLYDGPFFAFHRGDLQAVLTSALQPGSIAFGKRLLDLEPRGSSTRMIFEDGDATEADVVIGADGVHSKVREVLFGPEPPDYHGLVAYRAIMPTSQVAELSLDDNTKWWAPDRYIIIYYMSEKRDYFHFVASVPEPWERADFSPHDADLDVMREAFASFHPHVRRILEVAPSATRWPLLERDPFTPWSKGNVVLLGDACHPTTPHMGQGAGMAFEDAVVLVRCLQQFGASDLARALRIYEHNRHARTSRIQHESHRNQWTKTSMDHKWVYGYDAMTVPLEDQPNDRGQFASRTDAA